MGPGSGGCNSQPIYYPPNPPPQLDKIEDKLDEILKLLKAQKKEYRFETGPP